MSAQTIVDAVERAADKNADGNIFAGNHSLLHDNLLKQWIMPS